MTVKHDLNIQEVSMEIENQTSITLKKQQKFITNFLAALKLRYEMLLNYPISLQNLEATVM